MGGVLNQVRSLGENEGPSPYEEGEHFQKALISTGRKGEREFQSE